jgi:hypothetical protein
LIVLDCSRNKDRPEIFCHTCCEQRVSNSREPTVSELFFAQCASRSAGRRRALSQLPVHQLSASGGSIPLSNPHTGKYTRKVKEKQKTASPPSAFSPANSTVLQATRA